MRFTGGSTSFVHPDADTTGTFRAPDPDAPLLDRAETFFTQLAGLLVGLLCLVLIAVPAAETLARRFLGRDIPGASVVAQNLTLWVGFLGALLAAGTGRHLALSTAEVLPQGWPRRSA